MREYDCFSTYYLVLSVNFLQLLGHLQCPIWASVVNHNNLIGISTVDETN